ncbi:MAG TPA: SAM-dependent chlorinase/fluorinase [Chloroflexota bacterium]
MRRCITFLTDFGLEDHYVGTMKGVVLGINPDAVFVDICHAVGAQDIREGAVLLEAAAPYFPDGTVHVAVVDPGVGTARRAIAIEVGGQYLVGPDNGLLTLAVSALARRVGAVPAQRDGWLALPPTARGVVLDRPSYWLPHVSATFHGRDVFAPVAAHLSRGVGLDALGTPVERIVALALPAPSLTPQGVRGEVVHVDRFGNLITNLRPDDLPPAPLAVEIAGRRIDRLSRTFQDGAGLIALVGSMDRLEIAVPNGNAAAALGVGVGEPVVVRRGGSPPTS